MIRQIYFFSCLAIFLGTEAIIDNRYFPLYHHPSLTYKDRASKFESKVYFMTADQARDNENNEIGIPELWGKFDQIKISNALVTIGKPNPLSPQFRTQKKLIWDWTGKLSAQGIGFCFEYLLPTCWSIGLCWDFMHLQSRNKLKIGKDITDEIGNLSEGQRIQLEQDRRKINEELGLSPGTYSRTGASDLDLYVKYSWLQEYFFKCRRLDISTTLGLLIPTGTKIEIDNPASLPFGGNGHWGLYFKSSGIFELKEDLFFGISTTFLKRLPKTDIRRMPINDEPIQYGAVVGSARVNPGFTFGLFGYIELSDFWDKIGAKIGYNLVVHGYDKWTDKRSNQSISVDLKEVRNHSNWASEYVRLGATYHLNENKKFKKLEPKLYLDVNVPVHLFGAKDVCRTALVALGLEVSF